MSTTVTITGPDTSRYPYRVNVCQDGRSVAGGDYATADEARDVARLSARCWGGVVRDETKGAN